MPLKLVAPRQGKSPNWTIRGTHLKVYVDRTSGTARRSVARAIRDDFERKIERGEYPPRPAEAEAGHGSLTFAEAAAAYLKAGKRRRYVKALVRYFADTPAAAIDQAAIDGAATAICRASTKGGGRNAAVYTPVAAILHHSGIAITVKRPKGAKGAVVTDWLPPDDVTLVLAAAREVDAEFGLFLETLYDTGLRPSEPLSWQREEFNGPERRVWTRRKKGGIASFVKLRAGLAQRIERHLASHQRRRIFRFHQGGHLTYLLVRARLNALGLPCPRRRPKGWREPQNRFKGLVNFKLSRHTWATWMRIYGGLDNIGLAATHNWRDPKSAARYMHALPRAEWDKVELLPDLATGRRGKSVE